MNCPYCDKPRREVGYFKSISVVWCETCNYSALVDRINPTMLLCAVVPGWPPPQTPLYKTREER